MTYFHSFNSFRFDYASIHSDNAVLYLIGKALLNGKVLYKDIFDHKTPYIYFINMIASILDTNHIGLYILTSIILFLSLYFVYKIVYLFTNNDISSLVSASVIGFLLNNANFTLGFLRTEGYAVSFILISAYLFIKFFTNNENEFNLKHMFLISILATLTLMINIKSAILYVPFAFSVAY